ncbi:MAG: hypothetical protein AB7I57_04675 [Pirellulales bacterium]
MSTTSDASGRRTPRPNEDADKKSPNYRARQTPRGGEVRSGADAHCRPVKPSAAPSSAAENHDSANLKCEGKASKAAPQTASKDDRERATG